MHMNNFPLIHRTMESLYTKFVMVVMVSSSCSHRIKILTQ